MGEILKLKKIIWCSRGWKEKELRMRNVTLGGKKTLFWGLSNLEWTQELQLMVIGSVRPSSRISTKNIALWCSFSTTTAPISPKPWPTLNSACMSRRHSFVLLDVHKLWSSPSPAPFLHFQRYILFVFCKYIYFPTLTIRERDDSIKILAPVLNMAKGIYN